MALHLYPYNEVPTPERVGFARRFLAAMLDNLLVSVLALGMALSLGSTIVRVLQPHSDSTEFSIFGENSDEANEDEDGARSPSQQLLGMPEETFSVLLIANSVMTLLYSLLELFTGASVGKRLLGLVIASDTAEPATRTLLLRRWWVKFGGYLFVLIPFLSTIGSIWGFMISCGFLLTLGASHQALHDMAVHSAVFFSADIEH
ncbi:MAG: RDD family protein [Candidatus Kapaibacterium sp.]|nr:MAG: RDD family protein [Candidatus Kapabacteria bacterium]